MAKSLAETNMTGGAGAAAQTLLQVTPVLFVLITCAVGLGVAYNGLRNAGLVGVPEEWEDEYKETIKEDPNRNYRDYVKQRLEVERMIRNSTGWRRIFFR